MKNELSKMRFTDAQVTGACDLHEASLRKLITWRAVIPVQQGGGRGRVRLWAWSHVRRIRMIALIMNAGYSLKMAHTISYCAPSSQGMMAYDPGYHSGTPKGLKPILDPDNPEMLVEHDDWFIEIVNGKLVFERLGRPICFGRLNAKRTGLVSYWPIHIHFDREKHDIRPPFVIFRGPIVRERPKWETSIAPGDHLDPKSLSYEFQARFDVQETLDHHARPLVMQSINVTLGLRIAYRKVVGLPIKYP